MTYQELYEEVKAKFSRNEFTLKRFSHIERVIRRAVKLNDIHKLGLPVEEVKIACLLHDYGKLFSSNEISLFLDSAREEALPSDYPELFIHAKTIWHSFIGALWVKRDYPFVSDHIIDAIKYHTTGKPNMTTLGMLLYVSDATEESRTYENIDYYHIITEQDFLLGFKEVLIDTVRIIKERQYYLHPLTKDTYEFYIKEKLND